MSGISNFLQNAFFRISNPPEADGAVQSPDKGTYAAFSNEAEGPFTEPMTLPGATKPIFLTKEDSQRIPRGTNLQVVSLVNLPGAMTPAASGNLGTK